MNACSSRSAHTAALREGRGAAHETEVTDTLSIVTTTARIDTSYETNKIARVLQFRVGQTRGDRDLQISLDRMLITRPRMAVT